MRTMAQIVTERDTARARLAELRSARGRALAAGDAVADADGEDIARLQRRLDDLEDAIGAASQAEEEAGRLRAIENGIARRAKYVAAYDEAESRRLDAAGKADAAAHALGAALRDMLAASEDTRLAVAELIRALNPNSPSPGDPPHTLLPPAREHRAAAWLRRIMSSYGLPDFDDMMRWQSRSGEPALPQANWPDGEALDAEGAIALLRRRAAELDERDRTELGAKAA